MQRLIEKVLIKKILDKYEERYKECDEQWHKDMIELECIDEKCAEVGLEWTEHERKDFLLNDITSLNAQVSAYECIIKDLKGLVE